MKIRAKMLCDQATTEPWGGTFVRLSAVSTGNPEDNNYALGVASALVEMTIDNPAVLDAFVPGKKYYVDFTPEEESVQTPPAPPRAAAVDQAAKKTAPTVTRKLAPQRTGGSGGFSGAD
jgi:hypothetical protein